MKIVTVKLRVKEGKEDEFIAGVRKTVKELEKIDGTYAFTVTQCDHDPREFRFFEIYRDEAAFQAHMRFATTELAGTEAMHGLVESDFQAIFGKLVAGGSRLGVSLE